MSNVHMIPKVPYLWINDDAQSRTHVACAMNSIHILECRNSPSNRQSFQQATHSGDCYRWKAHATCHMASVASHKSRYHHTIIISNGIWWCSILEEGRGGKGGRNTVVVVGTVTVTVRGQVLGGVPGTILPWFCHDSAWCVLAFTLRYLGWKEFVRCVTAPRRHAPKPKLTADCWTKVISEVTTWG